MPPAKTITLDDLSPEDRARLLADAQTEDETAELAAARRRADLLASKLRERDHLEGCPVLEGTMAPLDKVEAYASRTPEKGVPRGSGLTPNSDVTIVRCRECGGSTVHDIALPHLLAQLEEHDDPDDPDDL